MTTINFSVGIVKATPARYGIRAPKGGCTVNGRTFKGGQFCLPFDPANPHGKPAAPVIVPAPAKVAITGFTYTVREIPAGECGTVAYRMHRIDTNHTYDVIRNHFGEVTCDCPDYECRRAGTGQMCKHGAKLVELGMIPAPARPEPEPAFDGVAMLGWARAHDAVGRVSATGRGMGFGGYIKSWTVKQATAVYFALETATVEGGVR